MLAELAYGSTKGCFQTPRDDLPPESGLSCPDIMPIEFTDPTEPINREAMNNSSQLKHPDVSTSRRYVSGTRSVTVTSVRTY